MKKIRIDYYTYRLQNGNADIFLQANEGNDEYCLPYRYVEENQQIAWYIKKHHIEDDENGDLVIIDCTLNDYHIKKRHKGWVSLDRIMELTFPRNGHYHVYFNIFAFFLSLCPQADESGIRSRVEEMLEKVKINAAKQKYRDKLQNALDHGLLVMDASYTLTDPELLKKEIETLEHFRLYKPDRPVNTGDGMILDRNEYSFEPIEWQDLGFEIQYAKWPSHGPKFLAGYRLDDLDEG